jgi:integrase/recombinase XerD
VKIGRCVELFVERKRVCGYEYDWSARILRNLAVFVSNIDISLVTTGHIHAYLSCGSLTPNTWRSHRSLIRRFFAYWFARRQVSGIPEVEQRPTTKSHFFPYVYSKQEIARLLAAAPSCQAGRRCGISPATLSTIVLFLYGTGMRVKEALALRDSDIDFYNRSIEICPGSLYRHRTIPMGGDVQRLLKRHLHGDERLHFGTGKALFLTMDGLPVTYNILRPTFRRLRTVASVFRPNSSLPPRLQDLRHTFAVHSITCWAAAGWSFEKMLPMLSAYMGNVREKGFLRYFELTPSCYRQQLSCLTVASSASLFSRSRQKWRSFRR